MQSKSPSSHERTPTLCSMQSCFAGKVKCNDFSPRNWSRTFIVRIITAVGFMIAAVFCSTMTFFLLSYQESVLYDSQYEALVDNALDSTKLDMKNKFLGAEALAEMIGQANPNSAAWPNVTLSGYMPITERIIDLSTTRAIAFAPIVNPDELAGFDTFAREYYKSNDAIPAVAGLLGTLKFGPSGPERDLTGESNYGSPNNFLTPALQIAWSLFEKPNFGLSLFNLHSDPTRGAAIDNIYKCAKKSSKSKHCEAFTDFLNLVDSDVEDASTLIISPIFPSNNATELSGFIVLAAVWKDVLSDVVPSFVSGLDLVIESSSGKTYTYTFKKGKPELRGEGDKHDRRYDSYKKTGLLAKKNSLAPDSLTYTISYYPRDEFFDYYRTELPVNATIAVVLIMLLTTAIFIVHDYFLKRESNDRQHVLETKRKFVRFISHEIRTPLNTVALGLRLLESELKDAHNLIKEAAAGSIKAVDAQIKLKALSSLLEKCPSWLELTDDISTNNESAISVLNDLLNYDKIQMGTMTLDCSQTNLWLLSQKVAKSFEIQAKQVGVSIVVDLELRREGVTHEHRNQLRRLCSYGDEMRLTQVLRNLISNALKFTPRDGKVLITVDWNPSGLPEVKLPKCATGKCEDGLVARAGSLLLSFKDTGAGLSKEQLTRIFTEGVQFNAKELQAGQGSGLGLAISKGLIAQHGGTMTVASEGLGKGCSFLVELPVLRTSEDTQLSATTLRRIGSASPVRTKRRAAAYQVCDDRPVEGATNQDSEADTQLDLEAPVRSFDAMKLLVVDDSLMNRKMLTRLLVKQGHRCIEAEDGLLAVEQYKSCPIDDPFDCILMDYEMPNLNGPEAAKQLRELGCTLVIVGVTGNVLPEDRKYYLDMGANAVLPKPLNIAELEEVWREAQLLEGSEVDCNSVIADSVTVSRASKKRVKTVDLSDRKCNEMDEAATFPINVKMSYNPTPATGAFIDSVVPDTPMPTA